MKLRHGALLLAIATGCQPPPPAPEGLDASATYMVRNFWADDASFQAGIQGFLNWFEVGDPANGDPPGKELVGLIPGEGGKTTDAFTLADLEADDVAHLPLADEILLAPNNPNDPEDDEVGPRDTTLAKGVVSLAEMDCSFVEAENFLARPDQNTVFPKDWESYARTYVTERPAFHAGTESGQFTRMPEGIDPYADGFDPAEYADTILITENIADPTPLLGVDMPGYPLALEFRHGKFELELEDTIEDLNAFLIITYNAEAVWGATGDNGLRQSYSIEINLERPGDKVLRMLAVWAEPISPIISADSALALNFAVSKSRDSSVLLSEICAGEVEVPPEP